MKRIVEHLYIGTVSDVPFAQQSGMSILGACKNPLHRQHAKLQGASEEGYLGRAMDRNEPEYLFAERDHALYLNLIDARDVKYIPDVVIEKAFEFIDKEIAKNKNVLIACNKGESRSPSIALMWMIKQGMFDCIKHKSSNYMIYFFKSNYYDLYNPSNGMREYVIRFFDEFYYDLIGGN